MRKRRRPLVARLFFSDFDGRSGDEHPCRADMPAIFMGNLMVVPSRGVACGGPVAHFLLSRGCFRRARLETRAFSLVKKEAACPCEAFRGGPGFWWTLAASRK